MLPQVQELGVEYLPGAACYADGSGPNQLRLSFSFVADDLIETGIRAIGEVAAAELREARV
jgi:DNA-binding transcriptional MocR family regulator